MTRFLFNQSQNLDLRLGVRSIVLHNQPGSVGRVGEQRRALCDSGVPGDVCSRRRWGKKSRQLGKIGDSDRRRAILIIRRCRQLDLIGECGALTPIDASTILNICRAGKTRVAEVECRQRSCGRACIGPRRGQSNCRWDICCIHLNAHILVPSAGRSRFKPVVIAALDCARRQSSILHT